MNSGTLQSSQLSTCLFEVLSLHSISLGCICSVPLTEAEERETIMITAPKKSVHNSTIGRSKQFLLPQLCMSCQPFPANRRKHVTLLLSVIIWYKERKSVSCCYNDISFGCSIVKPCWNPLKFWLPNKMCQWIFAIWPSRLCHTCKLFQAACPIDGRSIYK